MSSAITFKPINELFLFPPRFFVENPTLVNFLSLASFFNEHNTRRMPSHVSSSTASSWPTRAWSWAACFISALAAYPLAKHKMRFGPAIFNLIVTFLMFCSRWCCRSRSTC